MNGYIKIDRKITEWEWWDNINTFRLFIYMVLTARTEEGFYKGELISRGSFPSSISELSVKTKLTENEVRTAIKHLKSTGEITSKPQGKFTVFTIKNYDVYQSDNKQNHKKITGKITRKSQGKSQENHSQLTKNKAHDDSNKNEKDRRKKVYYPNDEKLNQAFIDFIEMRKSINKPITTERAIKMAMSKLQKLSTPAGSSTMDNDIAIKILEQSIFHDWQGLFELKDYSQKEKDCNKNENVNSYRKSQLDYLLNSIKEAEQNE